MNIINLLSLVFLFHLQKCLNYCERIQAQLEKSSQDINSLISQIQVLRPQCLIEITPKYMWAQNMTHLHVYVSFISYGGNYGCKNCIFRNVSFQYAGFAVIAYCSESNFLFRYGISVRTFKGLNYNWGQWRVEDQNNLVISCLKSPSPYFWKTLYAQDHVPSEKAKIWWLIYRKYWSNVQNFMGHLIIQSEDTIISNQITLKRRHQQILDIQFYCKQNNPYYLGSWL